MLLSELFKGAPDVEISQISSDSRMPMKNALFFCIKGIRDDGHQFIRNAIENGAKAIVYEDNEIKPIYNAIYIKVNNVLDVFNQIADKFYGHQSDKIDCFVVSGTNGRSSIAYLIYQILLNLQKPSYVGRFGVRFSGTVLMTPAPTMTILENQRYLQQIINASCDACVFEGTPESFYYKKLNAIKPKVFIYSSTSKSSADYKELGNDYFDTYYKYLYQLPNSTSIILNHDDESFEELAPIAHHYLSYGIDKSCDYQISDLNLSQNSSTFAIHHQGAVKLLTTKLLGLNNVYNLTAAIAAVSEYGYDLDDIIKAAKNLSQIPGVMETVPFKGKEAVIIDCACQSDSILDIKEFVANIKKPGSSTISIYGVNNTDDPSKLNEHLDILAKMSDLIILTEDRSGDNDINTILDNASKLIKDCEYLLIENREVAIEVAIDNMQSNDIVLILGKGNEKFLIRSFNREYYDGDKELALKAIKRRMEEENEAS